MMSSATAPRRPLCAHCCGRRRRRRGTHCRADRRQKLVLSMARPPLGKFSTLNSTCPATSSMFSILPPSSISPLSRSILLRHGESRLIPFVVPIEWWLIYVVVCGPKIAHLQRIQDADGQGRDRRAEKRRVAHGHPQICGPIPQLPNRQHEGGRWRGGAMATPCEYSLDSSSHTRPSPARKDAIRSCSQRSDS